MSVIQKVFTKQKGKLILLGKKLFLISIIFIILGNILYYFDINGYFNRWSKYPGPGGTVIHLSITEKGDIIVETGDRISYAINISAIYPYNQELFEDGKLKDEYLCEEIEPNYLIKPPIIAYEKASLRCKNKENNFIIHMIRSNDNELWKWNTTIVRISDAKYYYFYIIALYIMQLSLFLITIIIGLVVLYLSRKIRPTRESGRPGLRLGGNA